MATGTLAVLSAKWLQGLTKVETPLNFEAIISAHSSSGWLSCGGGVHAEEAALSPIPKAAHHDSKAKP